MAPIRGLLALALLGALSGCSLPGDKGEGTTPSSPPPAANVGFGGPDPSPPPAEEVDEAMFRTPSKNIECALTKTDVRCDIVRKSWTPSPKPADCQLDWGNGLSISGGKSTVTCAGDTLIGSSDRTLDYGQALKSGTLRCDSDSSGMTCKDEKTGHGFTLSTARGKLF